MVMKQQEKYKFRGINRDGKFIYGYYFRYENDHNIVPPNYSSKPSEYFKVDPETVGQYSGIKDNNKQDIYPGDIISFNMKRNYIVVYENGAYYLYHTELKDSTGELLRWGLLSRAFELDNKDFNPIVIGNIIDNKELIK